MIVLTQEKWVLKEIDSKNFPGVKARFKQVPFKEFKVIVEADADAIVFGKDEAKEALEIIARSVKDIEGIEVIEGELASYQDILELGSMNLVASFFAAFIAVQQDSDFLSK